MSMYGQPQAARSTYATQAAKWKNTAESPWKAGGASSSASSSVSELVLISELCSSIGQTSFPPKDVMNTLLRHVHALDHTYLCELLETKLEDSLWQVVARALAVLDALLSTAAASTCLDYFSIRKGLLLHLTRHVKQTVKSRAEKVFLVLDTHVPTQVSQAEDDASSDDDDDYRGDRPPASYQHNSHHQQHAPPSSYNRAPSRQGSVSSEMSSRSSDATSSSIPAGRRGHQHFDHGYGTAPGPSLYAPPVTASPSSRHTPSIYQPPVQDLLLGSPIHQHPPPSLFGSLTVAGSAPQPPADHAHSSAFSFLSGSPPSRPQSASSYTSSTYNPPTTAQQFPPSSMGFLTPPPSSPSNTSQSSRSSVSAFTCPEPSPTPSSTSAFSFVQDSQPSSTTAFSFLQQPAPPSAPHTQPLHQPALFATSAPSFQMHPPSQAAPVSAFSFLSGPAAATASPKRSAADRIHDAFADLSVHGDDSDDDNEDNDPFKSTCGDASSSLAEPSEVEFDSRSEVSDDFHHHHRHEPPAAPAVSARDEFEALKKAGMAREVILEVEVPPGPMGIILDRTTPESAILAEYAPLPSGDKGYIELHPAICPGCLLVAINGNSIEHLALPELGPVLANAATYHRVLTFKKFMVGSRVMHPSKLKTPYAPPRRLPTDRVSSPRNLAATWASSPPTGPRPNPVRQSPQPATNPAFLGAPAMHAPPPPPQPSFGAAATSPASSAFSFMQPHPVGVSPRQQPQPAMVATSSFSFLAATQAPSRPFSPSLKPNQPPPPTSSSSAFSFI